MHPRLALAFILAFSFAAPVFAQEPLKQDDTVSFDLSAEDWVTTKTAHVTLDVEASVTSTNAGAMRADMTKAINDAAKADWRLTGFSRSQDQTGMERWSVTFDARLPESALNGLPDVVKKASKAGMQVKVGNIDFAPTLDENEAVRAALRARLFKAAGEQLTTLNSSLPGRGYRIAEITFEPQFLAPRPMFRNKGMMESVAMAAAPPDSGQAQDHSQKLAIQAHIVFAALPPPPAAAH